MTDQPPDIGPVAPGSKPWFRWATTQITKLIQRVNAMASNATATNVGVGAGAQALSAQIARIGVAAANAASAAASASAQSAFLATLKTYTATAANISATAGTSNVDTIFGAGSPLSLALNLTDARKVIFTFTATAGLFCGTSPGSRVTCDLLIDGVVQSVAVTVMEITTPNIGMSASISFQYVADVAPGNHTISVRSRYSAAGACNTTIISRYLIANIIGNIG